MRDSIPHSDPDSDSHSNRDSNPHSNSHSNSHSNPDSNPNQIHIQFQFIFVTSDEKSFFLPRSAPAPANSSMAEISINFSFGQPS